MVVCALGGGQQRGRLPESCIGVPQPFITGGERSLYELATALAVLGLDVELRGTINETIFTTITGAAGAAPRVGLPSRTPRADDLVIVPEALPAEVYLSLYDSPSSVVLFALAPPGLWGWDFDDHHGGFDPMTVPFEAVATACSFRAIAAAGFTIWTTTHGIAEAGHRAGVDVRWIGTGTPVAFPDPPDVRDFDAAVIECNRWYPWAAELAARLPEAKILAVPPRADQYSLAGDLGAAKLLLWPSRIEAMSRIAREARGAGTVPVALDCNPFVTTDDHGRGVVLAPDLHSIVTRARELLGRPDEVQALSAAAMHSAREQVDWNRYVERVGNAVRHVLSCAPMSRLPGDETGLPRRSLDMVCRGCAGIWSSPLRRFRSTRRGRAAAGPAC